LIALNKQEKEKLVLDLYFNQGKNYRQIAKEARISPREIKRILDKGADDVQEEIPMSVWAKAYKLFEEGRSPLAVAVALNLRADKVSEFYREFWDLKQIHDFNKMFFETGGHLAPILKLYKMLRAAGYHVEQVTRLLRLANNDLPRLELLYNNLKWDVNSLETSKQSAARVIQEYSGQIKALGLEFYNCCLRCEEQGKKLADLRTKRMREENLVRQFQNNTDYLKIKKTVDERAHATLSDRRKILELASLSVIESIRDNPEKYGSLIRYNAPSTSIIGYTFPDFPFFLYGQQSPLQQIQQKVYFIEDYVAMLTEDANKVLEKLVKELGIQIIDKYAVTASFPSLPLLPASEYE